MKLTAQQIRQCMPQCSLVRATQLMDANNAAMERVGINNRLRTAAWMATLGHESMDLAFMKEIASGAAYEGRADLGNVHPGDGRAFKGRGPIQITGRANYTAFAKWSGIDCVKDPVLLEDPEIGFLASAWFWMTRGLNDIADTGNFLKVSTRVNGKRSDGFPNGWKDRETRYNNCLKVLP